MIETSMPAARLTTPSVVTPLSAPGSLTLRALFRANRAQMLATYSLLCIENLLRMAQPFVLGLAINDLLAGSWRGVGVLILQHLTHMLIGTFRQMYDTRVFAGIYADLASDLIGAQKTAGVRVSTIAARSSLSRSFVDFFEHSMPMLIRAVWSIGGALVMLGVYSWQLIPWCAAMIVPAMLLNGAYGRRTYRLSGRLHDQMEREVDVIRDGNRTDVRDHYETIGAWNVRLSDAEAMNFSVMEIFVLGLMVAVLVQYCSTGAVRAGDVFAVFRYVMLFVMGLDSVPRLVSQFSRLREIGARMRTMRGSVAL